MPHGALISPAYPDELSASTNEDWVLLDHSLVL